MSCINYKYTYTVYILTYILYVCTHLEFQPWPPNTTCDPISSQHFKTTVVVSCDLPKTVWPWQFRCTEGDTSKSADRWKGWDSWWQETATASQSPPSVRWALLPSWFNGVNWDQTFAESQSQFTNRRTNLSWNEILDSTADRSQKNMSINKSISNKRYWYPTDILIYCIFINGPCFCTVSGLMKQTRTTLAQHNTFQYFQLLYIFFEMPTRLYIANYSCKCDYILTTVFGQLDLDYDSPEKAPVFKFHPPHGSMTCLYFAILASREL